MFKIRDRLVGSGQPVYIVAEMSANHNQSFDQAVEIIRAAHEAGADAVKAGFLIHRNPSRKTEAIATVIIDRVIGLYALLVRLNLHINWIIALFGLFVAATMGLVIMRHNANQREFDSVALIGDGRH